MTVLLGTKGVITGRGGGPTLTKGRGTAHSREKQEGVYDRSGRAYNRGKGRVFSRGGGSENIQGKCFIMGKYK